MTNQPSPQNLTTELQSEEDFSHLKLTLSVPPPPTISPIVTETYTFMRTGSNGKTESITSSTTREIEHNPWAIFNDKNDKTDIDVD